MLSQVHVALDIFYQHIVYVYWGVVYNHHLCLCVVHLKGALYRIWCGVNRLGDSGVKVV